MKTKSTTQKASRGFNKVPNSHKVEDTKQSVADIITEAIIAKLEAGCKRIKILTCFLT